MTGSAKDFVGSSWNLKSLRPPPLLPPLRPHNCRVSSTPDDRPRVSPDVPRAPTRPPSPPIPPRLSPSVRRPGTSACPSNRPWACVCCAGGVSCERCSVRVWGKVFVSPSPGPSVCCASAGCARCCGSSSGRTPGPGPTRRGPHLGTHDKGWKMLTSSCSAHRLGKFSD